MSNTYVLAVDHRNSLRQWLRSLSVAEAEIEGSARTLKALCAGALHAARAELADGEQPLLLVDEQYGADAIALARAHALSFVVPAEVSGQPEFLFEHGEAFGAAIERLDPYAVKALVRYNVGGDQECNRRSRARLARLQTELRAGGRRFMLELLVPPTADQQRAAGAAFDERLRPQLTARAIGELAGDGLRPDWWKLEGNRDATAAAVVSAAAAGSSELGCLVLGRGQDHASVVRWIQVAAAAGSFAGFAVGRTLWNAPFRALLAGALDRNQAQQAIAAAYLGIAREYRQAAGGR